MQFGPRAFEGFDLHIIFLTSLGVKKELLNVIEQGFFICTLLPDKFFIVDRLKSDFELV